MKALGRWFKGLWNWYAKERLFEGLLIVTSFAWLTRCALIALITTLVNSFWIAMGIFAAIALVSNLLLRMIAYGRAGSARSHIGKIPEALGKLMYHVSRTWKSEFNEWDRILGKTKE